MTLNLFREKIYSLNRIYILLFAIKLLILVFKFYQKVFSMTNKPVNAIEFQIHQIKL